MLNVRMHKILIAGLLLGVAWILTAPVSAAADTRTSESWIAEKNGASIVVSGVRHGSGMPAPSPQVRSYFERSSVLMTEFDFTDARRTGMALTEFRRGESLAVNKFLNTQELDLIHSAWTKKLGGKASMSARTLGELHACGLGLYLLPASPGTAPMGVPAQGSSWEKIFLDAAKAGGKPIVEVEPRGSLLPCTDMSREQVRDFVLGAAMLGLDDKARAGYAEHSAASSASFAVGDSAAGYARLMQAFGLREEYKSAFLRYMAIRDKGMMEVIEQQHARLPSAGIGFAMVGALHLHGETGILALLEARGFRVTRL